MPCMHSVRGAAGIHITLAPGNIVCMPPRTALCCAQAYHMHSGLALPCPPAHAHIKQSLGQHCKWNQICVPAEQNECAHTPEQRTCMLRPALQRSVTCVPAMHAHACILAAKRVTIKHDTELQASLGLPPRPSPLLDGVHIQAGSGPGPCHCRSSRFLRN